MYWILVGTPGQKGCPPVEKYLTDEDGYPRSFNTKEAAMQHVLFLMKSPGYKALSKRNRPTYKITGV